MVSLTVKLCRYELKKRAGMDLSCSMYMYYLTFLLTVMAATLIFISGRGSAISSAKEGKSGSIYNLVKN